MRFRLKIALLVIDVEIMVRELTYTHLLYWYCKTIKYIDLV